MRIQLVIGDWGFDSCQAGNSFVEIDHEIFSMFVLSLSLIQEGHLSVSGGKMCTIPRGLSLTCKSDRARLDPIGLTGL